MFHACGKCHECSVDSWWSWILQAETTTNEWVCQNHHHYQYVYCILVVDDYTFISFSYFSYLQAILLTFHLHYWHCLWPCGWPHLFSLLIRFFIYWHNAMWMHYFSLLKMQNNLSTKMLISCLFFSLPNFGVGCRMQFAPISPCISALCVMRMILDHIGWWTI